MVPILYGCFQKKKDSLKSLLVVARAADDRFQSIVDQPREENQSSLATAPLKSVLPLKSAHNGMVIT